MISAKFFKAALSISSSRLNVFSIFFIICLIDAGIAPDLLAHPTSAKADVLSQTDMTTAEPAVCGRVDMTDGATQAQKKIGVGISRY